jgi:hypothetical protein
VAFALLRDTAAVTPNTEQPFTLDQMAGPPRRRDGLYAGIAIGAVLLAAAAIGITHAITTSPSPAPTAVQQAQVPATTAAKTAAARPTPTYCASGRLASGYCAGDETVASPESTVGETCADSAAWEQQGGTELIDAYINNQDGGNVNVEDIKAGCPQYLPVWKRAQGGIPNGSSFAVPAEVKPGTYETTSSDLEDCYWERSRGGNIVDNRFITASKVKQRVTIRSTDDTFVTRECGNWVKVS